MSITGIHPKLGAAPTPDPLTTLDIVEDFVTGGATTAIVGALGWNFAGGTLSGTPSVAGHPGIARRDTSSSSGTIAYTRLLFATAQHPLLASEVFDMTWVFRLNTNDANTKVRIGLSSDFTADAPNDAIYLEKVDADTSWFGTIRIATVETRTAALAAVDTGWHRARIRRLSASLVGFSLDGAAEVTIAATLAAGVHPGSQITNSAAAAKTLDHDFFRLRITGLTR